MRQVWLFLMVVAAACVTVEAPAPESPPVKDDAPVLRLNNEVLTASQFARFSVRTTARQQSSSAARPGLLGEFVRQRLLLQAAKEAGTTVSSNDVNEFIASTEPDEESDVRLREEAASFLLAQRYVQRQVVDQIKLKLQDALDYYSEHEDEYRVGNRTRVLEILLQTNIEAERLRVNLMGADIRTFRDMALRHSKGATADQAGDLGYFEEGDLPPDFEKFIFALRPGQVSGVFRSPHGYHLFLLEEWIPAHAQKFHEVQEEIFRLLRAERERTAMADLMNQLLESASIELYDTRYQEQDIRRAASSVH